MNIEKLNDVSQKISTLSQNRNIKKVRKKTTSFIVSTFRLLFLISIGYIILFPVFSALSSAIKTEAALFDVNLYWIPKDVTADNFIARVVWHGNLANIGTIVLEHRGTLFLVLIGILLLISANGVFDIIKTLDEKKKLTLEEEKEKEKIDWENKLREEVLAELENEKNNQNE